MFVELSHCLPRPFVTACAAFRRGKDVPRNPAPIRPYVSSTAHPVPVVNAMSYFYVIFPTASAHPQLKSLEHALSGKSLKVSKVSLKLPTFSLQTGSFIWTGLTEREGGFSELA